jgi:hypothetical protein
MTPQIIVGIGAFICGAVCAITATLVVFEMVARVNEKPPEELQFSPLWWYPSKYSRLFAEYGRLYPSGTHLRRFGLLAVLLFACFLVCVWGLGFFSQ